MDNVSYLWMLTKMNYDVSAGMVLDYEDRFALTLSAINDELIELKTNFRKLQINLHAQKMKLSIKDLVTFTEEILNENFLSLRRACY